VQFKLEVFFLSTFKLESILLATSAYDLRIALERDSKQFNSKDKNLIKLITDFVRHHDDSSSRINHFVKKTNSKNAQNLITSKARLAINQNTIKNNDLNEDYYDNITNKKLTFNRSTKKNKQFHEHEIDDFNVQMPPTDRKINVQLIVYAVCNKGIHDGLTLLANEYLNHQSCTIAYITWKKSVKKFPQLVWYQQAAVLCCFVIIKSLICEKECLYSLDSKVGFTNEFTYFSCDDKNATTPLSVHDHQLDEDKIFNPRQPNFTRIPKDWTKKIQYAKLKKNDSWKRDFEKGNRTRTLFRFLTNFIVHCPFENKKKIYMLSCTIF